MCKCRFNDENKAGIINNKMRKVNKYDVAEKYS